MRAYRGWLACLVLGILALSAGLDARAAGAGDFSGSSRSSGGSFSSSSSEISSEVARAIQVSGLQCQGFRILAVAGGVVRIACSTLSFLGGRGVNLPDTLDDWEPHKKATSDDLPFGAATQDWP